MIPFISSYSAIQSASSAFINQYILSFSVLTTEPIHLALVKPKLVPVQLDVIACVFELYVLPVILVLPATF